MTLKDCYFALEGDYEEVVGRLYSEALVQKFAVKFLADKSFQLLDESLKAGRIPPHWSFSCSRWS